MALQVLTDGTNFTVEKFAEHIDNSDIHVAAEEKAAWSEKEVFIITLTETTAEDGTTSYSADKTFAEIKAASDEGKMCVLKSGNLRYILTASASAQQIFISISSNIVYSYKNLKNTGWIQGSFSLPPRATSADEGKILTVDSDGNPIWAAIVNAEGVAY